MLPVLLILTAIPILKHSYFQKTLILRLQVNAKCYKFDILKASDRILKYIFLCLQILFLRLQAKKCNLKIMILDLFYISSK